MRVSKPGQIRRGNMENKKPVPVPQTEIPAHGKHFNVPMHYGKSQKSGRRSGGFYWNPPLSCEKRVLVDRETGDRWIDVGLCRECKLHKKGQCEAAEVKCGYQEMC